MQTALTILQALEENLGWAIASTRADPQSILPGYSPTRAVGFPRSTLREHSGNG
ncbi:hypothetical protein [Laspinema palackyanum]|uniref:hypothetical protein n=1 Tax=Laspinema palackyanum TaxID=3231601 RepID=UPI00345CDF54|nr:hypothetical protein [Laspinema sp. D2c]